MATFILRADGLRGLSGLSVNIYTSGGAIANGAGDSLTEDGSNAGLFSATVDEPLSGVHFYSVFKAGVSIYEGQVYCSDASFWIADLMAAIRDELEEELTAIATIRDRAGQTATVRNVAEFVPIQFTHPVPDLENGDWTIKRRYFGNGTAVALQGSITFLRTIDGEHWYELTYDADDRPTVPQVVTHELSDGSNATTFVVYYTTALARSDVSGTVSIISPVNEDGTINPIVIGDDYLTVHGRSFDIFIDPVDGVDVETATCFFGGSAQHKGSWLVQGVVTLVVDRWRMRFQLQSDDTIDCKKGCYEWSAELRPAESKRITRITGTVELIQSHTIE